VDNKQLIKALRVLALVQSLLFLGAVIFAFTLFPADCLYSATLKERVCEPHPLAPVKYTLIILFSTSGLMAVFFTSWMASVLEALISPVRVQPAAQTYVVGRGLVPEEEA